MLRLAALMIGSIFAGLSLSGAPASAASTNATPVMVLSDKPVDATKLPWINDDAKNYIANLVTQYQNGQLTQWVVAAAPNGTWGVRSVAPGPYVPVSLEELTRQALEQCEYNFLMPCRLIAANNKMASDANGSFAQQPNMLEPGPSKFDYTTVPFVGDQDRQNLRAYGLTANPKVMMITSGGYWTYKQGKDVADALAQAITACTQGNNNTPCDIYAINNNVILDTNR